MHHQGQGWAGAFMLSGLLVMGTLSGCGVGTYNTDVTVNGTRKIEQKIDGVVRKLETDAPVVFENGTIATFPAGAVLRIQEIRDGKTRRAELREKNGQQALFIEADNAFRASTPNEQAWFQTFFKAMNLEDRDKSDLALKKLREAKSAFPEALEAELEELSSSDKAKLLESVAKQLDLTPPNQVAVVEAVFDEVTFASSQTDILLALIQRPNFAAEAEQKIRDRIDDISFKSSQDKITAALDNRANSGNKAPSSSHQK
ncbi:MAG: hypothetical protein ACFCU8_21440 [Thermosynechococcaceae cyanobacterium]